MTVKAGLIVAASALFLGIGIIEMAEVRRVLTFISSRLSHAA
jgi:hypothetical protein